MPRGLPIVLAALLAAACSSDETKRAAHLERAEAYLAEEKREEALIELRNALALDPQNAEINFRIAKVMLATGDLSRALYYLRETRRLAPDHVEAHLTEARLLRLADPDEAWKVLNAAIELQPGNAEAQRLLARLYIGRKDLDAALAAAERGAELAPDQSASHLEVGRVRVIRIIRAQREHTAVDAADYEAALAALDRAGELAPPEGIWPSRVLRALALAAWPEHAHEVDQAFRDAVAAAERSGPEAVVEAANAALAHARSGPDEELRRWALDRIVAADASRISAWVELAALTERSDGSAETVYRRLLAARPRDAEAHLAFASFLSAADRMDEGLAHLQATADQGVEPARLLGAVARAQFATRRSEEAHRTVERLEREHPDDPITAMARAERLLDDGHLAEAASALRAIVGSRESADALHLLARTHLRQGELAAAKTAVDRAIELEHAEARHRALRVRIQSAAEDWASVLDDLRWIEQRARRLARPEQLLLARAFFETDRVDQGRKVLAALVAEPDPYVPALLELARREGERAPEVARQALERAHALAPDQPEVLARLAAADVAAGRRDKALARLDAAIERAPGSVDARLMRGRLLAADRRLPEATADARAAFGAAPHRADVAGFFIQVLGSQGEAEAARAALEEQQAAGRLSPGAQVLLARLSHQLGHVDRAAEIYEQVLAARSDLALVKNDLAFILAERGQQLERAQQLATEALSARPGDHRVLDTLGYVLLRRGQPDLAVNHLEEAVAAATAAGEVDASYHYHLGLALRGVRRNRSAVEAFDRALALDPDLPEAQIARREREAALAGAPPTANPF